MVDPYLGALGIGYLLKESGLNVQDLFNEMFNLGPPTFVEEVGVLPPSDVSGDDPADVADPGTGAGKETEVMEEQVGTDLSPEMAETVEEMVGIGEETRLLPGAIIQDEPIIPGIAGQLTDIFPSGTGEAVVELVASLTAADLRARSRRVVRVEAPTEEIPEPFVSSSAQEAGLAVQRGFIDGVEIGGEEFQIP